MEKLGRSYQLLSWKINAGELDLRELLDRANDSERKPTRERSQLERETNSEKKTSLQTPACLTRCVPEKKRLQSNSVEITPTRPGSASKEGRQAWNSVGSATIPHTTELPKRRQPWSMTYSSTKATLAGECDQNIHATRRKQGLYPNQGLYPREGTALKK